MTVRTFDVGDRVQPAGNKPGEAVGTIAEISKITMHDGGRSYRVDFDDGVESGLWWKWYLIQPVS